MDRIHRLGQRRPVQAIKLVVEDSIESRIVQLQEKKSAMVDATLSTDDSVRVLHFTATPKIADRYGAVGDGPTHSRRRTFRSPCHCAILIYGVSSCPSYSEYSHPFLSWNSIN